MVLALQLKGGELAWYWHFNKKIFAVTLETEQIETSINICTYYSYNRYCLVNKDLCFLKQPNIDATVFNISAQEFHGDTISKSMSRSDGAGDLTGKVGTALYVSPEMMTGVGKMSYSQVMSNSISTTCNKVMSRSLYDLMSKSTSTTCN